MLEITLKTLKNKLNKLISENKSKESSKVFTADTDEQSVKQPRINAVTDDEELKKT